MKILRGLSIAALGVSAFLLLLPSVRATEYPGSFVNWTSPGIETATTFVGDSDVIIDADVYIHDATTFLGFNLNGMILISPSGTAAYLFDSSDTGGITGKSLYLTRFDDSATQFITVGVPPYTGSFRPIESFSVFDGEFATGTWTLAVYNDALGGNTGRIDSWSLILNPDGTPLPTPSTTPTPGDYLTPTPTPRLPCTIYPGSYLAVLPQRVMEDTISIASTRMVGEVTVNIEDFYVGCENDLDNIGMYLVSPRKTVVAMFEKHQLSEHAMAGAWFESSDVYPVVTSGVGPYIGRWRPVGDLNTLKGEPVQGDWELVIFNDHATISAYLVDWNLVICEAEASPTPTSPPLSTPTPTPFAFKSPTPTPTPRVVCRTFAGPGFSWLGVGVLTSTVRVPGGRVFDIDVTIDEASYDGGLSPTSLYLLSPDLTHVALFEKQDLSGNRLYQTTFDSAVGLGSITDGEAPYLGSYNPVESLSAFSGQTNGGDWTLLLYNESADNPGSLAGWELRVCAENPYPTPTSTPSAAPTPSPTPSSHPPIPTPVPACPVYIGDPFIVAGTTVEEKGLNIVEPGFVGDLDIQVSYRMVDDGDLDYVSMYLRSGQGTVVELFPKHVLSEHALHQTRFDDDAPKVVTEGSGPYVGSWRPMGVLADFNNEPITGTWTLIVFNDYSCEGAGCLDAGIVDDWRIYLCAAPSRTPTPVPTASALTSPTPTPIGYHTPIPASPSPTPPCIDYIGSTFSWTGVEVATSIITVSDPGVVVGMQLTIDEAYCADSWDSVGMYLMGPSGEDVALFEKHQLDEHQFYLTTFDDGAASSITGDDALAPYIGSWRPQEPLSNFNGEWSAGTWTLVVYNDAGDNSGNVTGWRLSLCAFPPPTATPTPPIVPPTPTPLFGALPILASGDYNGDGSSDIGVYRPSVGQWIVPVMGTDFLAGKPASGDYDGDGTTDIAVFRPATGEWVIDNLTRFYFGAGGDVPAPGDYNGDGSCDAAVFRGGNPALWAVRGLLRTYFGTSADLPIPGDYDNDGATDIAVFRPSTALWAVKNVTRFYFGGADDFMIPRDYAGAGSLAAIFRPATGIWAIRGFSRFYFGGGGDLPVPADFDGDGRAEAAIFRGSSGLWAIRGFSRIYYGASGDIPVAR